MLSFSNRDNNTLGVHLQWLLSKSCIEVLTTFLCIFRDLLVIMLCVVWSFSLSKTVNKLPEDKLYIPVQQSSSPDPCVSK